MDKCEYCKYWDNSTAAFDVDDSGVCRRYPPQLVINSSLAAFPVVEADEGCGEFVKNPLVEEE